MKPPFDPLVIQSCQGREYFCDRKLNWSWEKGATSWANTTRRALKKLDLTRMKWHIPYMRCGWLVDWQSYDSPENKWMPNKALYKQ